MNDTGVEVLVAERMRCNGYLFDLDENIARLKDQLDRSETNRDFLLVRIAALDELIPADATCAREKK